LGISYFETRVDHKNLHVEEHFEAPSLLGHENCVGVRDGGGSWGADGSGVGGHYLLLGGLGRRRREQDWSSYGRWGGGK
jgi:hypothetical protein